jgi:hypothetical protein
MLMYGIKFYLCSMRLSFSRYQQVKMGPTPKILIFFNFNSKLYRLFFFQQLLSIFDIALMVSDIKRVKGRQKMSFIFFQTDSTKW